MPTKKKTKATPIKSNLFDEIDLANTRILGIDPAIAKMGYALVFGSQAIDYGVITTPAKTWVADRLAEIERDVTEVIVGLKPDLVAIELPHFALKIMAAGQIYQAIGILNLVLHRLGYSESNTFLYYPSEVKAVIAGHGNADKKVMQAAVQQILGLEKPITPDDANDAVAIGLCLQLGTVPKSKEKN